ncbi:hypothetical protein AB1E19_007493 [Capra hircus]
MPHTSLQRTSSAEPRDQSPRAHRPKVPSALRSLLSPAIAKDRKFMILINLDSVNIVAKYLERRGQGMEEKDLDGDDLPPPPYWLMTRLPLSAPPGPEAALTPDPGPGEVPAAAAPPPALPEFMEPPFRPQQRRPLVNAPKIPPQVDLLDCI